MKRYIGHILEKGDFYKSGFGRYYVAIETLQLPKRCPVSMEHKRLIDGAAAFDFRRSWNGIDFTLDLPGEDDYSGYQLSPELEYEKLEAKVIHDAKITGIALTKRPVDKNSKLLKGD